MEKNLALSHSITQSIKHPDYLMPREPKRFRFGISDYNDHNIQQNTQRCKSIIGTSVIILVQSSQPAEFHTILTD